MPAIDNLSDNYLSKVTLTSLTLALQVISSSSPSSSKLSYGSKTCQLPYVAAD